MDHKDRITNGGKLLLFVNENLPCDIINTYKFKENYKRVLFEFSASNNKWLFLGNHKPPLQNDQNPTCIQNHSMQSATFATGLSYHHKPTTITFRKTISKVNSKKNTKITRCTNLNYSTFQAVLLEISNLITTVKVKVIGFNNSAYMTKSLRKAIMLRSSLKNNFNKKRCDKNWNNYKTQRNFCVKLVHQTKEKYFNNVNVKSVSDNKKFWKTIKPFFFQ